jgi:hypothetical protein
MMTVLLGLSMWKRLLVVSIVVNNAGLTLLGDFWGSVLLFKAFVPKEVPLRVLWGGGILLFGCCNHRIFGRDTARCLWNVLRLLLRDSKDYIGLVYNFHLILCLKRRRFALLAFRLDILKHMREHLFVRRDVIEILQLETLFLIN